MQVAFVLQELFSNGATYNLSSVWSSGKELLFKMPFLMSSIRSISKVAFTYAQTALLYSGNYAHGSPPVCSNPQLSCQTTATVTNTCCSIYPGGQLLQTQLWDTNPPTGPVDSWTVHGLWSVLPGPSPPSI